MKINVFPHYKHKDTLEIPKNMQKKSVISTKSINGHMLTKDRKTSLFSLTKINSSNDLTKG